ncbi:MAG TPA: hypothetical protein QGI72_00810 [Poseidonia sp.]|nr:hypothetical protein [Poseidonia sp.]
MAAMTKKEGARRILDAQASLARMKNRAIAAGIVGLILAVAITVLTRWQFGLASVLLFGLLMQFSLERMGMSIRSSQLQGLKALGWKEDTVLDEACMERLNNLLDL